MSRGQPWFSVALDVESCGATIQDSNFSPIGGGEAPSIMRKGTRSHLVCRTCQASRCVSLEVVRDVVSQAAGCWIQGHDGNFSEIKTHRVGRECSRGDATSRCPASLKSSVDKLKPPEEMAPPSEVRLPFFYVPSLSAEHILVGPFILAKPFIGAGPG